MATVHRQITRNLVKNDERDILTYLRIDAWGYKLGGEFSREPQKLHGQMTTHLVDNRSVRVVVAFKKILTHYLIE